MLRKILGAFSLILLLSSTHNVMGMKAAIRQIEERHANLGQPHFNEATEAHWDCNQEVAAIVHLVGSKKDKLKYYVGDHRWPLRKDVIKSMIEDDEIDPNTIKSGGDYGNNLLFECALLDDLPFANYLIAHGAKPDKETIEYVTYKKRKALAVLLSSIKTKNEAAK